MEDLLRISLVTLGDSNTLTGGYLYHQRMAAAAPRHGAEIDFVSLPTLPFPLHLAGGYRVARAARGGYRVVVLDSIAAAGAVPWLYSIPRHIPIIGMLHQPPGGIDHDPVRSALQGFLDRAAYRRCGLLLVASESLREYLVARGWPAGRIEVIAPGRDVAPRPSGNLPDLRHGRDAAILCVANWVRRKGIHSLLEAVGRLPPDLATLHLAGDHRADPAYGRELHRLLESPDMARRVVVHGPLSREAVAALYSAADVFVLPSVREPYGTVYGEAMAFGLPVVGWRAGNLPHLAQHEREGLLVDIGDVNGLAQAIERLCRDESLRRRLGDSGRRRALARPTWEESATQFFSALRGIAGTL